MVPGAAIHEASAPALVAMNPRLEISRFMARGYGQAGFHLARTNH
jgi:hypothetical protein